MIKILNISIINITFAIEKDKFRRSNGLFGFSEYFHRWKT
jgi:hypothetical protein